MLVQTLFTLLLLGCATLLGTISFLVSLIILPRCIKVYLFNPVCRMLDLVVLLFDLVGHRCEVQKFRAETIRRHVHRLEHAVVSPMSGLIVNQKGEIVPLGDGGYTTPSGILIEGDITSCVGQKVDDFGMIIVQGRRMGQARQMKDLHIEQEYTILQSFETYVQEAVQAVEQQSRRPFCTQHEKHESFRQVYVRYRNNTSHLTVLRERFNEVAALTEKSLENTARGMQKLEQLLSNDLGTWPDPTTAFAQDAPVERRRLRSSRSRVQ